MDTDELIDRLNTLQAQNIALMHMLASAINQTGADVRAEYAARCAMFRMVTEPNMDTDAAKIQREVFARIGSTVLGDSNAIITK